MRKRPRLKPQRDSPLIDPAVTALVLVLPEEDDLSAVEAATRDSYQRSMSAIAAAADIADVPTFVLSHGASEGKHRALNLLPKPPRHRFVSGPLVGLWQSKAFIDALDGEDRSVLVVAGVWLEYHVLTTALHAMTDGYDVYIALDATPARTSTAARLSMERLLQFGATPVLSSQVVHEWCLESRSAVKRSALEKLFATLLTQ